MGMVVVGKGRGTVGAYLRFTIWGVRALRAGYAERKRSGIFETMRVVGSKATGVSPCRLWANAPRLPSANFSQLCPESGANFSHFFLEF